MLCPVPIALTHALYHITKKKGEGFPPPSILVGRSAEDLPAVPLVLSPPLSRGGIHGQPEPYVPQLALVVQITVPVDEV